MIFADAWKDFSEYSEESSIHSMQYIGRQHLHFFERLFWICAFLFSFSACSYLIYRTYDRWVNDPVLFTFNKQPTPTWKIPFPALTICPDAKINVDLFNLSEALNIADTYGYMNDEKMAKFQSIYQICDGIKTYPRSFFLSDEVSNKSHARRLIEMTNEILINARYISNEDRKETFHKIVTNEGVCHTFNMLDEKDLYRKVMAQRLRFPKHGERSHWSNFGYGNDKKPETYPHRILGSGKKAGLTVLLGMRKKDIDFACSNGTAGFRLTLHTPDEFPRPDFKYLTIPFNMMSLISVIPQVLTTSKNLKNYEPRKRKCYFQGEKQLKFFKHYTQSNCKLECLTEFVRKKCGCVKFSMPHENTTKMCTSTDIKCMETAESDLIMSELEKKIKEDVTKAASPPMVVNSPVIPIMVSNMKLKKVSETKACGCLPSCSSIFYNTEMSQTLFDVVQSQRDVASDRSKTEEFKDKADDYIFSKFEIYFKEDEFIESKRTELYGWTNFLSNCGGFLGLLMGGSLLSLVEIFYHCTMKNFFKRRREMKERVVSLD
ncbi:CLUMA_CG004020, isoform A [Clunio marinus]|uniref:CLUMA_CG004020, isoform A n=1 Tax=Clunio marinus TaxID=568069 RepID=A0A1J1HSC5_9DIPT|nr:CLUMA_CG004020, isoform A [Clunio marinus]